MYNKNAFFYTSAVDINDWRTTIVAYLRDGTLPKDKSDARRIRTKAARFSLINSILYRWSFSGPYTRCLSEQEATYVLKEIHEGECGNHFSGRSLCNMTKRQGYYWPTMLTDSEAIIKQCDKCQRHSLIIHKSAEQLLSIRSPYPFKKYSMDIVGPLPRASRQHKYLLVLTDYHEVGRSGAICRDQGRGCQNLHLKKHHLKIRHASGDHDRQRIVFYLRQL